LNIKNYKGKKVMKGSFMSISLLVISLSVLMAVLCGATATIA